MIREGGLVAFPTETVYGLGANALDPEAIERIFAAKGRPAYNPLIAHVSDVTTARELSARWSPAADLLAAAFWPGPLTLVVPKQDDVPARLTAGLPTVAIRVPSHPVARALIREAAVPIAAPSANRFTELSPTLATHVVKGLADRVDLVLDGGPTSLGIESTVIDVSSGEAVLLRPGTIPREALEEAVGGRLSLPAPISGSAPRPGPGMVERHYSPRAQLIILSGDLSTLVVRLTDEAAEGRKVGVLLSSDDHGFENGGDFEDSALATGANILRLPSDPDGYARELYAALHALDEAHCDTILARQVPEGSAWAGVRDRLRRASYEG